MQHDFFAAIPEPLRRYVTRDRFGDPVVDTDRRASLADLRGIAAHADGVMDAHDMAHDAWTFAFRLWTAAQVSIAIRWPQHRWQPTEPTAVAMLAQAHDDARRWREAKAAGMLH